MRPSVQASNDRVVSCDSGLRRHVFHVLAHGDYADVDLRHAELLRNTGRRVAAKSPAFVELHVSEFYSDAGVANHVNAANKR